MSDSSDKQRGGSNREAAALLERLRQSGLSLDRRGVWWHQGRPVEHPRVAAALDSWLDRLEDGRYVVRLDAERFAYVEVEDTPYLVRTITLGGGMPSTRTVTLYLSDETTEELGYASLRVSGDNMLYCLVKDGRFEARFSRIAHQLVFDLVDEADGGYALRAAGKLWPILPR